MWESVAHHTEARGRRGQPHEEDEEHELQHEHHNPCMQSHGAHHDDELQHVCFSCIEKMPDVMLNVMCFRTEFLSRSFSKCVRLIREHLDDNTCGPHNQHDAAVQHTSKFVLRSVRLWKVCRWAVRNAELHCVFDYGERRADGQNPAYNFYAATLDNMLNIALNLGTAANTRPRS